MAETPPPSEWKKQFGDKCKLSPDGRSFELKVRDDADIRRAHEMQSGAREEEVRRGAEMQGRMKRERVVRRDGRVLDIPEEALDHAKGKLHSAGRNGFGPGIHFGLSDAFARYEQGPDGLWFVDDGGWEPTEMWRAASVVSPQRDPDGNEWVERNGEWFLGDEVD